jgi:hypothetical protein
MLNSLPSPCDSTASLADDFIIPAIDEITSAGVCGSNLFRLG